MARVSRKAALSGTGDGCPAASPERAYNAAAYVRLSVEDNGRTGDKESIAMQQYMLEKYIGEQPDMLVREGEAWEKLPKLPLGMVMVMPSGKMKQIVKQIIVDYPLDK